MTNNNSLSITYAATNSTLTSGNTWGYTSASIPAIYYGSTSITPAVVGWEKQLADLELVGEKIIKNSGNFPPYNQIKVDDDNYILELAIAGFSKKDISVYEEKGALIIEGKIEEEQVKPINGKMNRKGGETVLFKSHPWITLVLISR